MKRTRNINRSRFRKSFVMVSVAMAITFAVAGCEKADIDMKMYKNVDDCIAQTHKPDQCRAARSEAEKVANETAPRYATFSDCEAEFGMEQCRHNPAPNDGGSSWMPLMMGYMMGNMAGSGNSYASPLYQNKSGQIVDNKFRSYDVKPGQSFKATRSAARPSVESPRTTVSKSSTTTRGGFGGKSSSGSFGG